MARRGWGGSIATAAGVAAGTGAAQLGFGYGLGIINWAPADADAAPAAWVASLIWATWIAATSTILGAVCAYRLHERGRANAPVDPTVPPPVSGEAATDAAPGADPAAGDAATDAPSGTDPVAAPSDPAPVDRPTTEPGRLRRVGIAVAAGLGGLVTVLLVAVPARVASPPDTGTPQRVAAAYAAIGVLMGVLTALWALRSRAAAGNVVATVAWLWLLAVVAVVDGVLAGRGLTSAQLGIWQISSDRPDFWIRDYLYWPGAVLSLGSALVIGALAARRAARAPRQRIGAATSGAAGPLLVAIAYLLALPRLSAITPEQVSAHLIAPYAVIVGVGGSVLVAALAQRTARRAVTATAGGTPRVDGTRPDATTDGSPDGPEPTTAPAVPAPARPARPGVPGDGSDGGATTTLTTDKAAGARVPAQRAAEHDRVDPVGAGDQEGAATPDTPTGRRGRSSRRTS
ncbi:hypothetical protein [Micromonospora costi]|uniref:Uncharacterized protein n=1 Tax=Micromonospora costi TaxID=1530042 RepID=A0A3A9ZT14_9ACTN|nr:hypothetical protein [Micromonospora costi]RKN51379.1 hypothetical protein D7193_28825 [Micromonospora costi]